MNVFFNYEITFIDPFKNGFGIQKYWWLILIFNLPGYVFIELSKIILE